MMCECVCTYDILWFPTQTYDGVFHFGEPVCLRSTTIWMGVAQVLSRWSRAELFHLCTLHLKFSITTFLTRTHMGYISYLNIELLTTYPLGPAVCFYFYFGVPVFSVKKESVYLCHWKNLIDNYIIYYYYPSGIPMLSNKSTKQNKGVSNRKGGRKGWTLYFSLHNPDPFPPV